jgi:hypothetical protein
MAQASADRQPLDDVMLAMDVVDTLRHQQVLIDRELNAQDRDRKLIERLREIYASQGIDVPDHVLEEGVAALKEDRFNYTPPPESFQTRLASLYVRRGKWGKPLLLGLGAILIALLAYTLLIRGPAERELAALPARLEKQHELLLQVAKGEAARERSESLYSRGRSALAGGEKAQVMELLDQMSALQAEIEEEYELRIVSRPGERSGVWRIPDANSSARNYYLIVEAITPDGRTLTRNVVNEEDGKSYRVDKWGLRVDESLFERIAADKQDDGIIQQSWFGVKRRGYLTPEYLLPTTGAALTAW